MKDPLGCPLDLLPVGICFPSTKDKASSSSSSKNTCESGGGGGGCGGDDNGDDPGFHTCQILIPAEWSWFSMHAPKPPRDGTPLPWARHATTHHAAGSKSSAKHSGSNGATAAGGGGGGDGNGAAAVGERTDPEGYAKLKAAWSSRLLQVSFTSNMDISIMVASHLCYRRELLYLNKSKPLWFLLISGPVQALPKDRLQRRGHQVCRLVHPAHH